MVVLVPGCRVSPLERARLGAEILAHYVRARWGLRRGGLPEAVAGMRSGRVAAAAAPSSTWPRLAGAVVRVLEPIPADSRCLVRSLVLVRILARRGIETRLVIGVRSGPSFAAHAWVEHQGTELLPAGDGEYERLMEL